MGLLDFLKSIFSPKKENIKVVCPNCKKEFFLPADRCPHCGVHTDLLFGIRCPKCKTINSLNAKKCKNCNADLEEVAYSYQKEKQIYICPICGYRADYYMTSCPVCKTKFV